MRNTIFAVAVSVSLPLFCAANNSPSILNLSSRAFVGTGDQVLIGGFVIDGVGTKLLQINGRGQSIPESVPNRLSDPEITLVSSDGTVIDHNDNWNEVTPPPSASTSPENNSPLVPTDASLRVSLDPGSYTVILKGKASTTGIGIVEIFDLDPSGTSSLTNLSARAQIGSGDNVLIGGVVFGGETDESTDVIMRGRGGSLAQSVDGHLPDPQMTIFEGGNVVDSNDDWGSEATQLSTTYSSYAPNSPYDSALVNSIPIGARTAIIKGAGESTGIGIFEIFPTPVITEESDLPVTYKPKKQALIDRFPSYDPTVIPKIIIDTDLCYDSDDWGTLAAAHALHKAEVIELLAVIGNLNEKSAQVARAFNDFWNHPEVRIGTRSFSSNDPTIGPSNLQWDTVNRWGAEGNYENALDLYKDILGSEPAETVTVVSIGYLNNLSDLADQAWWAAQSVKEVVAMAGNFRGSWEHNAGGTYSNHYARQATNMENKWPGIIRFIGSEAGGGVQTGCRYWELAWDNPMNIGWRAHLYVGGNSGATWGCNYSPDQMTLFSAALPDSCTPWSFRGPVDFYFNWGWVNPSTPYDTGWDGTERFYLVNPNNQAAIALIDDWQLSEPWDQDLQ